MLDFTTEIDQSESRTQACHVRMLSLEGLFEKNTILTFSWYRQELRQNGHLQVNHSKLWEHWKPSCGQSVFFIYVQMDRIEEPPRTFYVGGRILYYIFHNE